MTVALGTLSLSFSKYQPLALRTEKMLPSRIERLNHAAMGLLTEGGEFVSELKRVVIYGKEITSAMLAHIKEELGDTCWYIAIGMDAEQFTMGKGNKLVFPVLEGEEITLEGKLMALTMRFGTLVGQIIQNHPTIGGHVGIHYGSLLAVVVQIAEVLGIDVDTMLGDNILKLEERYPDKYSDMHAEARLDKGGLDHTQS